MIDALSSNPLALAFGLVFIAELGDKTQLIALAFATRYRVLPVLSGVILGTLLIMAGSVGIGATIGSLFAEHWLKIVTGALLVLFALLIVRESGEEEEEDSEPKLSGRFGPVLGVAATIFIAELGDKTMLAAMGLAAQTESYLLVWVGASGGMILANVIGVGVGRIAGKRLPERMIRWVAGTIFFASGVLILADGIRSL